MAAGMDLEDAWETRMDPNNVANRFHIADFNMVSPLTGKVEKLEDVLKSTKEGTRSNYRFEHTSGYSQALVYLAETVIGKSWAHFFDRRVWSKMSAEGTFQIHTTPDGIACAHKLASSTLRDLARFGMLCTPSWNKTASEQVVTQEILDRIHDEQRLR